MRLAPLLEARLVGSASPHEKSFRMVFLTVQQHLVDIDWSVKLTKLHEFDDDTGELHPIGAQFTDDETGNTLPGTISVFKVDVGPDRYSYGFGAHINYPGGGPADFSSFSKDFKESYEGTLHKIVEVLGDEFQDRIDEIMDEENDQADEIRPRLVKELEAWKRKWQAEHSKMTEGFVNSQKLAARMLPDIVKKLNDVFQAYYG